MKLSITPASARTAPPLLCATVFFAFATYASAQVTSAPSRVLALAAEADASEWIQIFNGKNLDGWQPKFTGHELGENFNNTFRVEDGMMEVRYDQWTEWKGEFGHIFYERPFSYYIVRTEYRFPWNRQVPGATETLAWAIRNNGIMVHSQAPESMGKDQDFPISFEAQLLGGAGDGKARPTGNICTPGTNMVMKGELITQHCINSTSPTFDGDQWVTMEVVVLGDTSITHIVNGEQVMTYDKPQMGGDMANKLKPGVMVEGAMLTSGYISLQAESSEIDFRKVEVLNLEGCMDPGAANYREYYVKSDPTACNR